MSPTEALLSPDWYRLAFMRPRLRPGVGVSRQRVRGQTWYVLSDPVSGRHHRVNEIAYGLIACCDGRRTLDDVWAARVEVEGEDAPTQGEAIRIFVEAFRANLFVGNVAPDAGAIVKVHASERRRRRRAAVNPFAFPVPLWDPDAWLTRWNGAISWLYALTAQAVIWSIVAAGGVLLLLNLRDVAADAAEQMASGRMLLTLWLVFPVVKALHELSHAFAVKAFGGEVHEIGVSLLMLTPVPYVNASASIAFPSRRQRMIVAAAGIAVEALLATAALLAWLVLEPGLVREIALAVVVIGGISTVIVNGNPLLRFDGYYLLSEALGLPNLAGRSQRFWADLLKRRLLCLRLPPARTWAPGERGWLVAYAPLSWGCRTALLAALVLALADSSVAIGLLVLVVGLWFIAGRPTVAVVSWLFKAEELAGQRARAAAVIAAGLLVGASLLLAVPVPDRSHAPAVVWLPDAALVRAGTDGFLEALLVRDGEAVTVGTPIARLGNTTLRAGLDKVEAEIRERQVERAAAFGVDAKQAMTVADELHRLETERARLLERIGALTVTATADGTASIDARRLRLGQYVAQGELLGQVLPARVSLVRALVSNDDIAAVRELIDSGGDAVSLSVSLASGGAPLPATFERAVPKGSTVLPTAALGDRAGGSIRVDADDPSGQTAREPRFVFDLMLDGPADVQVGTRALATFSHDDASLAELIGRHARRLFLRHFAT